MESLRISVAPYSLGEIGVLFVTSLAMGLIVTLQLWDWRPVDVRRVAVILREALPAYAVLAALVALPNSWTYNRGSVIVGIAAPRGQLEVLARHVLVAWMTISGATAIVLVPCLIRTVGAPLFTGDVLAIVVFFPSLLVVLAVAHLAAIIIPFPVAWVTTIPLSLASTVLLVVLNDSVLSNTGYSTLSYSLTWGSTLPVGASGFVAWTEAFRVLFFTMSAVCLAGATAEWLSLFRGWRTRALRGAAWLLVPVAVAVLVSLAKPLVVAEYRDRVVCDEESRVEVCVFESNEAILPEVLEAADPIVAQVPAGSVKLVLVAEAGIQVKGSMALFSSTLPPSRQEFVSQTAEEVALSLAGSLSCALNELDEELDANADWDYTQASNIVAETLLERAGYARSGASGLSVLTTEDFQDWWTQHAELIRTCRLPSSAVEG